MNLLVIGGSKPEAINYIEYTLEKYPDVRVLSVDERDSEASRDILLSGRYHFELLDILQKSAVRKLFQVARPTHVVLFHESFIPLNLEAVVNVFNACREFEITKCVFVSAYQVFGGRNANITPFDDNAPYDPQTLFACAIVAQENILKVYGESYNFPYNIIRQPRVFGKYDFYGNMSRQIINLMDGKAEFVVNGNGIYQWVHASDNANAIDMVLRRGKNKLNYNVTSPILRRDIELAEDICKMMGKDPQKFIHKIDSDDQNFNFNMKSTNLSALGYKAQVPLEIGLMQLKTWCKSLVEGDYNFKTASA